MDEEQIEKDFAALVATTITALKAVTTEEEDRAIWAKAIKEYGRIKVLTDGDANENIVHFFAVDGVGLNTALPVVCKEVGASKPRVDLWVKWLMEA